MAEERIVSISLCVRTYCSVHLSNIIVIKTIKHQTLISSYFVFTHTSTFTTCNEGILDI